MTDTLSELLRKCINKEEEAVRELVRRFQPWALNFSSSLLKDKDTAQDVVQEGFMAALEKLPTLRDFNAFPGWFRQILRTHVARLNRKMKEVLIDERPVNERSQLSPRETLQRKRLEKVVIDAIQCLPQASKDTIVMFYLDEMKQADIAERLHTPLGTVKRRLHDARQTLRILLTGVIEETQPAKPEESPRWKGRQKEDWK